MSLDQFLMKKLLKSEVCGTREQCTGALFMEKSQMLQLKKKKMKRDFKMNPNRYIYIYIYIYKSYLKS